MALIDVSRIPPEIVEEKYVDEANRGIEKLQSRLVSEIAINILPPYFIVSMAQVFFQGHTRRALMFIEGGYEAFLGGRGLVVYSCARAICETFACVMDFCDRLTSLSADGDYEKTCAFVWSRQHASRLPDFVEKTTIRNEVFDNTAVNVLTLIGRVGKQFPGLEDDYADLSERTHPNGLGALHHFWESGDEIIRFSNGEDENLVIRSLVSAGRYLWWMGHGMEVTERLLLTKKW